MPEQDNIQLIQKAYEWFTKGKVDEIVNLQAEDVEWTTPGPPAVFHTAGTRRGRQGVAEFFSELSGEQEVETFEAQDFIAQGDNVVAIVKYRSRVKATGKMMDTTFVHVFEIKDGKIKRFREFFDTASVMDAFLTDQAASQH